MADADCEAKRVVKSPFCLKIVKVVSGHWFALAGFLVIALTFWLRWRGLDWQLPDTRWGDEEAMIELAKRVSFEQGKLVIGGKLGFWYGPTHFYLLAVVFSLFERLALVLGWFPARELIPGWTYFLVARGATLLLSTAVAGTLVFLFQRFFGKRTAVVAGLFLALHYISVELAIIAKNDTLVVLLTTLTLYLSFRLTMNKGTGLYVLAGAVYGLAVGAKLFALGFITPLLVGHLLAQSGSSLFSRLRNAVRDWRWIILPIAAVVAYVLANPQIFLVFDSFWRSITKSLLGQYMAESNRNFKTVPELLNQLKTIYFFLLGPGREASLSALILAFAGLILLTLRRLSLAIILFVALFSAHLFILPATAAYGATSHYMVIVPIYALLIGFAVDSLLNLVSRIGSAHFRLPVYAAVIAALAFAISSMWTTAIRQVNALTGEGSLSRERDFRKWMIEHIPPGSRIAYDLYGTDLVNGYFDVVHKPGYKEGMDYYSQNYDYVVVSDYRISEYKAFQELMQTQKPVVVFQEEARFSPKRYIFQMNPGDRRAGQVKNFYTETLHHGSTRKAAFNDPSFEDGQIIGNWGIRFFNAFEGNKSIEWWDGKNHPAHFLIEKNSNIRTDGEYSLRIVLAEENPSAQSDKRKTNQLSEADSTFEANVNWHGVGTHSVSRAAGGNAFEGKYALQVVSGGFKNQGDGAYLTTPFFKYKNGQANQLTFYAKRGKGNRVLRVRSGDGTEATFILTKKYQKYQIPGSKMKLDNIKFALGGAGIFYLDSVKFEVYAIDKRLQIGQVIPYNFLDGLEDFSLDYYVPCGPDQINPPGSVKVHFQADSIGGHYLNKQVYVLYDSNDSRYQSCGRWKTFRLNVKADFKKPLVRWKDVEFMTMMIEFANPEFGSLEVYVDNIRTAKTRLSVSR